MDLLVEVVLLVLLAMPEILYVLTRGACEEGLSRKDWW